MVPWNYPPDLHFTTNRLIYVTKIACSIVFFGTMKPCVEYLLKYDIFKQIQWRRKTVQYQ